MSGRVYQLTVEAISVVRIVRTVIVAAEEARKATPERAWGAYRLHVSTLLPSLYRGDGADWLPKARDSDGWARLGAYLGALDGWAGHPQQGRPAQGEDASCYLAAYFCAYSLAGGLRLAAGQDQPS